MSETKKIEGERGPSVSRRFVPNRLQRDDDIVLLDFTVHGGQIEAITRAALEKHRDDYVIDDITTLDDYSRGWERYLAGLRKSTIEKHTKT